MQQLVAVINNRNFNHQHAQQVPWPGCATCICSHMHMLARMVPTSVGAHRLVYVPQHMYEDQTTEKNGVADPLAAWWPSP